jgi:hypothetical protein
MTEEQHDEREVEAPSAEAEGTEPAEDEEPDFELHGQYFDAPSA